jgi:anaerobic magnesium-protoporphyrin IX monomethyl ester cyclase
MPIQRPARPLGRVLPLRRQATYRGLTEFVQVGKESLMRRMSVVLWDTRKRDVSKDFAGGFGVGQFRGSGLRGRLVRRFYKRDRRPVAMTFAYLAAIFRNLGHRVEYVEDTVPPSRDLYVFNPSLITLDLEREAIRQARRAAPAARILVVGLVAHSLPEAFDDLDCTIVDGEPDALLGRLDEVLQSDAKVFEVGAVDDLDNLPFPDWDLFEPANFRIGYDFNRFPTGLVQSSRGCTLKCCYCPYIILRQKVRARSAERVLDEIRYARRRWGFQSLKFLDPLFGLHRKQAMEIAEGIARMPGRLEFSIESRLDLLPQEVLVALRDAGLTSITVGIETPDDDTLRRYRRAPIRDDKQFDFVRRCRALGIRTVAGFMIGFPEDTRRSIRDVLKYAKRLNPTFANFNICTPYPGTAFFNEVRDQIASFDWSRYNVYTPVMKYQHLTPAEVQRMHAKCFQSYYFRWRYLRDNATLLWPWLRRMTGKGSIPPAFEPAEPVIPRLHLLPGDRSAEPSDAAASPLEVLHQ